MGFKNVNKKNKFRDSIKSIKKNTDEIRKSPAQLVQNRSHIYCTFYNVNVKESTVHPGTEDIRTDIGSDSPLRYDKIEDCLIFGVEEFDSSQDRDDVAGFDSDHDNEAIVPADTFKPIERSFLKLEIENETILYQVQHVERTMRESIPFYKIRFEAEVHDEDEGYHEIEDQVVNTYTFLHENIGTENKTIIKNKELDKLEELGVFIRKLNNLYYTQYYDKKSKTICLLEDNKYLYYSPYVIQLLRDSKILYDMNHDNKLILNHELITENDFDYDFQNSFYVKITNNEELTEKDMKFVYTTLGSKDIQFNFTRLNYYCDKEIRCINKNKTILKQSDYMDVENVINLSTPDENSESSVDKFIYRYIKNDEVHWKDLDIEEIYNDKSVEMMMKIPVIILLCRYYYNNNIGKSMVGYGTLFDKKIL